MNVLFFRNDDKMRVSIIEKMVLSSPFKQWQQYNKIQEPQGTN